MTESSVATKFILHQSSSQAREDPIMKKCREVLGILALSLVVSALPVFAQDARLEAAKKEGKVVWYTSLALPTAEKIGKLFEAAYPGIKVEVQRTGSQRILQRVMQELQANLKLVDVIHTSDAGHFVLLKEKKLLMKYTPAGVDAFLARPHGQPVVVGVDDEETGHALRRGRSRSGSTR